MPSKTSTAEGTASTEAATDSTPRPGFNDKGERVSITRDGLKKEFGAKRGDELYIDIAVAGGFGNPRVDNYYPALDISGLKGEHKERVESILKGATKE